MTRDDTKKIIAYLRMAYSGFCEDRDLTEVVNVWYDALKDEDTIIVQTATKNYVKTSKFAPTIAGIIEQINLIKCESDADLWAKLRKAVGNSIYNSSEEFEKLPQECKAFVGSASALRDLAQTDIGTMDTIVKGQFLKNVGAIKEHQTVQNGLPMEVKQAIEASKRKLLEDYSNEY